MELKELILSTLEELDTKLKENAYKEDQYQKVSDVYMAKESDDIKIDNDTKKQDSISDERAFLLASKDRMEVLFEGLKSEQNRNPEDKLKLVINFLQFYITEIDKRLGVLSDG